MGTGSFPLQKSPGNPYASQNQSSEATDLKSSEAHPLGWGPTSGGNLVPSKVLPSGGGSHRASTTKSCNYLYGKKEVRLDHRALLCLRGQEPPASSPCTELPSGAKLSPKVDVGLSSLYLLTSPSPGLAPQSRGGDFEGRRPSAFQIPSRSFGIHFWDFLQKDSHTTECYKCGEPAGTLTDIPV